MSIDQQLRDRIGQQLQDCRQRICQMPGGDDLYQEVALQCCKSAASRDWSVSQQRFIHTVARRKSIDMHRRRVVRADLWAQSDEVAESSVNGPLEELIQREGIALLRQRVQQLPAIYRDTIVAIYFDGESPEHLAGRLGCPMETLNTRRKRGAQMLNNAPELRRHFR